MAGCIGLGGALPAAFGNACAQSFPAKPIRFVAAFPAGGPSDIVARAIGRRMSDILGQAVVIENRTGAGGNIGAEAVAKAPPDGHTLLHGGSFVTIAPSLYVKPPFPAGTPREIVNKLHSVIVAIVSEPETKNYLIGQGVDPVTSTPAQFAAYISSEIPKFAQIVKAAGIKPE